ncbi:L-galactose dehydrogenase [Halotydeus destructor]|nr:L-galactose dehydrogenase [Halotydeus destructor]
MNHVATFVDGFHNASDVLKVNYSRLGSTDLQVSRLSLGCAQISQGVEFDSDSVPVRGHEEAEETLIEAIKRGINYLDTSPFYGAGSSELVLGHVLKKVPRQAFYIATKVCRTANCDFDFSFENTIKMVNDSLRKLGVDYIDVIQVHDCEFADSVDDIVKGALPALDRTALSRQSQVHWRDRISGLFAQRSGREELGED